MLFHYDVVCYSCKKTFRVYESSETYQQMKKNNKGIHCCEDCNHKIRLEAILNFFK